MTLKTKDDFNRKKARMGTVKAASSRANKALGKQLVALEALIKKREEDSTDWSEATAKMTAEAIQKCRGISEQALENLENAGLALNEVILEMRPEDTQEGLEAMTKKVSEDIEEYNNKYAELKQKFTKTLEVANELTVAKKPAHPSRPRETTETPEFTRFQSYPDMEPTFLSQDSDMIEINLFFEQFANYLNMGYRGNPPNSGISLHLSPLMHSSWMQALTPKGLQYTNADCNYSRQSDSKQDTQSSSSC